MPDRVADLRYTPLPIRNDRGSLPLRGLWRVDVADRRFGGLSGLTLQSADSLLAVTDSGTLVELPKPGMGNRARLLDLKAGPGWPTFKKYRDSEALLAEEVGGSARSLWIPFEYRHSIWLFTPNGDTRGGLRLADRRWPPNKGVEGLVSAGDDLMLFPEGGGQVLLLRSGQVRELPLAGATGGIADAVRLPDGRVLVAVREVGFGLTNRLAWLKRNGRGYRLEPFATVPLKWSDNVEGLAAEPLPGGGARIWAVTDNDFSERRPTLLMTFDLPPVEARSTTGADPEVSARS